MTIVLYTREPRVMALHVAKILVVLEISSRPMEHALHALSIQSQILRRNNVSKTIVEKSKN